MLKKIKSSFLSVAAALVLIVGLCSPVSAIAGVVATWQESLPTGSVDPTSVLFNQVEIFATSGSGFSMPATVINMAGWTSSQINQNYVLLSGPSKASLQWNMNFVNSVGTYDLVVSLKSGQNVVFEDASHWLAYNDPNPTPFAVVGSYNRTADPAFATAPEPASFWLLGGSLVMFAIIFSWRKRGTILSS